MTDLVSYENWKKEQLAPHLQHNPQPLIGKQWLPETPFKDYKEYYDKILGFSLESKANGDILWGRVQGTESERKTLLYTKEILEKVGVDTVVYEEFPCFEKQWLPTKCELTIKYDGKDIKLNSVMTAFQSGQTPDSGVEADIIFVGEGSPSELEGKDLKGKIVLLSAHCYPNALLHSARKAFSRMAETGALGVIVWWQLPGNLPVAGRVGTPMGGDHKGAAIPWTSIAHNEGLLIRKLLDERAENSKSVRAHMTVQGTMEERQSGHVLGTIKGKTDKIILITMHVDGYFYAMHDNGAGVAMGLELARQFAAKDISEREYTMLFHFSGDHEVPGAGGTRVLAKDDKLMEKIIIAYQIEHVFSKQYISEAGINGFGNVQNAMYAFASGKQKNILNLLQEAANTYGLPLFDYSAADPMGDIQGLYKPFASSNNLLSAGYIEGTPFYHSTADVDLDMLCDEGLARALRCYQYILDKSQKSSMLYFIPAQFEEEHLFTSQYFGCLYSEF